MKKLNFGCGFDLKEGYDNLDKKDFNFDIFPYPIKDNTYDYIYSRGVLEHLSDPWDVLIELHRISKNGAIIELSVPHYNNKSAYSSLQHKHYFNEECFVEFLKYNPNLFQLKKLKINPSWIGRLFIFEPIRRILNLLVCSMYTMIDVQYEVIK